MEIERKFLISQENLPQNLVSYPSKKIQQGYLCTDPVVRIRRSNDSYYLTYKSKGLMCREEYNLPLNAEAYEHLLAKADRNIISKTRYLIPISDELTAEVDVFEKPFAPLVMAEVEFPTIEDAQNFAVPGWFGKEVTFDKNYHNSNMSKKKF